MSIESFEKKQIYQVNNIVDRKFHKFSYLVNLSKASNVLKPLKQSQIIVDTKFIHSQESLNKLVSVTFSKTLKNAKQYYKFLTMV